MREQIGRERLEDPGQHALGSPRADLEPRVGAAARALHVARVADQPLERVDRPLERVDQALDRVDGGQAPCARVRDGEVARLRRRQAVERGDD